MVDIVIKVVGWWIVRRWKLRLNRVGEKEIKEEIIKIIVKIVRQWHSIRIIRCRLIIIRFIRLRWVWRKCFWRTSRPAKNSRYVLPVA